MELLITKDDKSTEAFRFTYPKCFIEKDKDGLMVLKIPVNQLFDEELL